MKRLALLSVASISTVSCLGTQRPDGTPVSHAYHEAAGGAESVRFLRDGSPLARPMPAPVIYPPEIFPVFVPSHVDLERDMMVGDHYLFIKLRDSTWLSDKLQDADPPADNLAPQEELRELRRQFTPDTWSRVLVPYRERP